MAGLEKLIHEIENRITQLEEWVKQLDDLMKDEGDGDGRETGLDRETNISHERTSRDD